MRHSGLTCFKFSMELQQWPGGPLKHIIHTQNTFLSVTRLVFVSVTVSHIRCEMPRGWSTLGHWRFGQCWLVRDLMDNRKPLHAILTFLTHVDFDPFWPAHLAILAFQISMGLALVASFLFA